MSLKSPCTDNLLRYIAQNFLILLNQNIRSPNKTGVKLAWGFTLFLSTTSGLTTEMIMTPQLHPYERGYQQASIIVRGDIVQYLPQRGAMIQLREVIRGEVSTGSKYLLQGTANYSFLTTLPSDVIAFIGSREGKILQLWQGPTNGGLIWSEPKLFAQITRAHANPIQVLHSREPRERLAAAYYLVTNEIDQVNSLSKIELNLIIDSVVWGMTHGSSPTHQAAIDTFEALGYSLKSIGISYQPMFISKLKNKAAEELLDWWNQKHK
jgi:hypothetical protein